MNFLERLLQGIQAKAQAEQIAKERALAEEEAKRKTAEFSAEAEAVQRRARRLAEHTARARKTAELLERFSVRESLQATRDGVWKVGEIEPVYYEPIPYRYNAKGEKEMVEPDGPSFIKGYCLKYSYPAPIPIYELGVAEERGYDVLGHGGSYTYKRPFYYVAGYSEGRKFDAVRITIPDYSDGASLRAINRCAEGTEEEEIFLHGRIKGKSGDCQYGHFIMPYTGNYSIYPDRSHTDPLLIKDPSGLAGLERILIDYCHAFTRANILPLQSEIQEQRRLVNLRRNGQIRE